MAASTSAVSAICGTHLGETKAPASIDGQAGVGEALDQLDLDRGRDDGLLVLQPVARADFDDPDAVRAVLTSCLLGGQSTSSAPSSTWSPAA